MIQITDKIYLSEDELTFKATGASGPGGQNVNRVNTAIQLRFSIPDSNSLPEEVKQRLNHQAKNMINRRGELIIEASRHRTQRRNRMEAIERLTRLLQKSAVKPKKRRKTRAGGKAREKRLRYKHRRSEKKARRGPVSGEDS